MDVNTLLYIAFIIYIMVMVFGYMFKFQWLYMIAGFLWFIPLTQIDNGFIILISAIMIIVHFILGLASNEKGGFE
jgi:hypothetical protein